MFVSMQEKVAFHRGLQGTQISEADCCTYKLYLCKKGSVFATLRGMMKKTSNVQSKAATPTRNEGVGVIVRSQRKKTMVNALENREDVMYQNLLQSPSPCSRVCH